MKKITLKNSLIFLIFLICLVISMEMMGQEVFIIVNDSFGPGVDQTIIDIPGYGTTTDITIDSDGSFLQIKGEAGSTEILEVGGMTFIYDAPAVISNASETGGIIFNATQTLMIDNTGTLGNWADVNPAAYVGYRIVDGGGYHYGYVELQTNLSGGIHWDVLRVGYNQTLDASITVGSGVLSIDKNEFSLMARVVSKNNEILIKNLEEDASYRIYSLLGQQVKSGIAQKNNHTIDISNLARGMYVIKLEGIENGKTLTRKILK